MLPSAQIEINLDQTAIRKYIELKMNEEMREIFLLIDMEKLSELTCMSKRFLEDEIVRDVRMRTIERKKNRKRWWPYKQAIEVIHEITREW